DPFNTGMAGVVPGNIVAVWMGQSPFPLRTSLRPPGGAFGPITTLTETNHAASSYAVAVSRGGNAAVIWVDDDGVNPNTMAIAVYDATAPVFQSTSVPGSAFAGNLVGMFASATDDWASTPSLAW